MQPQPPHVNTNIITRRYSACVRCILAGIIGVLLLVILSPMLKASCGNGTQAHIGPMGPMCHEQAMSGLPHTDTRIFDSAVLYRLSLGFSIVVVAVVFVLAFHQIVKRKLSSGILYRMKFMRWLWSRSRPFSSGKNFIPYFTPVRDA